MNQMNQFVKVAIVLFVLSTNSTIAQENIDRPYQNKGTIENQFSFVYDQSYSFQIYKSVRMAWFQSLRANTLDTLKSLKKEVRNSRKNLELREAAIDSLKKELDKTHQELDIISKEKNSFRFLGMLLGKHAYNSLVWFIILGLAVLLTVAVLLFKRSNSVTTQTKKDLEELKLEFENFRKRSLEREEKMARKHLDELNKYKNPNN